MKTTKFEALLACVNDLKTAVHTANHPLGFGPFWVALVRCEKAHELACSDPAFKGVHDGLGALYGAYLAAYGFLMLCVDVLVKLAEEGVVTAQQLRDLTVCLQEANDEHLALAAELKAVDEAN